MKIRPLYFLFISLLIGCDPEKETDLHTIFSNQTSVVVSMQDYYDNNPGSLNYVFLPGNEEVYATHSRGGTDSFPRQLFWVQSDSIVVIFSDSLRIVHLSRELSLDTIFQSRAEIVLYESSRNLNNLSSYAQQQINEGFYEARYTFNEEDLNYAISIYE